MKSVINQIETDRLTLISLTLQELEQMRTGVQDFLEKSVLSDVIKLAITDKIEKLYSLPADTHVFVTYWLIVEQKSGRGVGLIGSKHLPDQEGYVELGYAVAEAYRGRGYMTEALTGFLDWLYEWPFIHGAILRIQDENIPSVRAAESCGFQKEEIQNGYRIFRYPFETVVSDAEL